MPLIVRGGKNCLEDVLEHPRIVGDPRNMIDMSVGREVPSKFWSLIKDFLAKTASGVVRYFEGREVVVLVQEKVLDRNRVEELIKIVKDLKYDRIQLDVKNGKIRLWNKGLPFNKIHVVGLGCNGKGDLVVLIVDGRQNESIGVTYSQPADLMIKEGIVYGGIGSAGGDVSLVCKDTEGIRLLNSTSNEDGMGKHITRGTPSHMLVKIGRNVT